MKTRHPVHGAEQAPATTTLRIRARIQPSDDDRAVLSALGEHLSVLLDKDLAARCRAGSAHGKEDWRQRKQALTKDCSSRWAGWVTKSSNDAYATARRNQRRALNDKSQAADAIARKLALPILSVAERKEAARAERELAKAEGRKPRHLDSGYRSASEHAMKRRRLGVLRGECARLERDIAAGRVHVTRGGKQLLRSRLHLEEAHLSGAEWRNRWRAARHSFGANGEAGKTFGNETIRLFPDGTLEVDLPARLGHLANVTARGTTRYRFSVPVTFSYRRAEWLEQVETDRACAYDVVFSPTGKVYLDASFTPATTPEVPALEELLADPALRVLAVDLNDGFLAPAVLDRSGNPVGRLPHVPLLTEHLATTTRDGHLRQAVTELLDLAGAHGCRLVVVENLGFSDMRTTGRERYGSNKRFRRTVCGIPTAQFRDRLHAMASRRGIAVAGVPAAYSSIWGAEHWHAPLSTKQHKVSRHTAAAVVLGRRALGHSARRRRPRTASPGVTAPGQRTEAAATGQPVRRAAGAASYHVDDTWTLGSRHQATGRPQRRKGDHQTRSANTGPPGARSAKTVRAGPLGEGSLSLSV